METYRERIEWIMRNRQFKSGRALSLAAGLSPATVNNLLMRERRTGSAALDSDSLAALARAADVDADWLATGRGRPDARTIDTTGHELPEPQPRVAVFDGSVEPTSVRERRWLAAALVARGVPEGDAYRTALAMAWNFPPDASPEQIIESAEEQVRRERAETKGKSVGERTLRPKGRG